MKDCFPHISKETKEDIGKLVSYEEIKVTLFNIAPLKAPRLEGLHAMFFQSQLEIMSNSVCEIIEKIFESQRKVEEINDMFLVLVPKVDNLEVLQQMRLISLCNVFTR